MTSKDYSGFVPDRSPRWLPVTNNFHDVREFMLACDQVEHVVPTWPSKSVQALRVNLIHEELGELIDAIDAHDMVEVADALADLLYVVYGAGVAFGINLNDVFAEVHRSNMTKIVNGKAIKNADGKVIKPLSYEPPDIAAVLGNSTQIAQVEQDEEPDPRWVKILKWLVNTGNAANGNILIYK
jgi:predicted HAD superfamily Cof-like phosphohydrolase